MSVLTPPRHPLVDAALAQARTWCTGQVIDDAPALAHAITVTTTLSRHLPDLDPLLAAAALLHDAPEFAPTDLDHVLTTRFGPAVTRIVRALETEHHALDQHDPPPGDTDRDVLVVATADKIVALTSLLRRANASDDPQGFWTARPALLRLRLRGYFHDTHHHTVGRVPPSMSDHLGRVLQRLDRATHHLTAQATAQPGDPTWTCDNPAGSNPNSDPDQNLTYWDPYPNKHWPATTTSSTTSSTWAGVAQLL